MMDRTVSFVGMAGLGAGLMYLLDPDKGTRRRAMAWDKATRAANVTAKGIGTVWRDVENRSAGIVAELRNAVGRTPPDDARLEGRVRSELGFVVRHPSAIAVFVKDRRVTLRGPILSSEVTRCLSAVGAVPGVSAVDNQLESHESPEGIPALQGNPLRRSQGRRFELFQENWSPTARLLAGTAGGSLLLYGLARRNAGMMLAGVAGAALMARAVTNLPMKRLTGAGAGHRAVDIRRTVTIAAPRQRVFEFWNRYREFPRYTRHVLDVSELGEGRSRWKVLGPTGIEFTWNSLITESIPNEVLAWKTEPGSLVQHAGIFRFTDLGENGTTIHMRLSYNPPGGALGHGVAAVLGSDLQSFLADELSRIKTFLETGAVPRDAGRAEEQDGDA